MTREPLEYPDELIRSNGLSLGPVRWVPPVPYTNNAAALGYWAEDPNGDRELWIYNAAAFDLPRQP